MGPGAGELAAVDDQIFRTDRKGLQTSIQELRGSRRRDALAPTGRLRR
jgi:hypothetical protein